MATKDWKKQGNYFIKKDKSQAIEILDVLNIGNYNVVLITKHGRKVLKEAGKYKSKAIAYAKAYMRKN